MTALIDDPMGRGFAGCCLGVAPPHVWIATELYSCFLLQGPTAVVADPQDQVHQLWMFKLFSQMFDLNKIGGAGCH